jgi:hypothetical protein
VAAKRRCEWAESDELLMAYHDEEWGVPVHDDRVLFEMLNLEGAQAGLSWLTILRKRDHYRKAFDGFDAWKIAAYRAAKKATLMKNEGIVRRRKAAHGEDEGQCDREKRAHEQGPEGEGIQVRGTDDLLRVHAGRGHGERSFAELLQAQESRKVTSDFGKARIWI